MEILGVNASRAAWYMSNDPTFPQPQRVTSRGRLYSQSEVEEWNKRPRRSGKPTGEDAQRRAKARKRLGWD